MADGSTTVRDERSETSTAAGRGGKALPDLTYTQNRELSWLRFDNRVLDEAFDADVPLFERMKFVSIFESNLDEFLMVRVGGLSGLATLKHQPRDNKSGLTPAEQVDRILRALPVLVDRMSGIFHRLESQLADIGIERLEPADLIGEDRIFVEAYFNRYVLPVISPLVIDPRHPFPNLRNGALYLVCTISGPEEESGLIGLIEIPPSLPRVIEVPSPASAGRDAGATTGGQAAGLRYILLEDAVIACLEGCFGAYVPHERAVIRVIRNADIDPDGEGVEDDEDYRQHMKRILKKRLRLDPVHLSVRGSLPKATLKFIRKALGLPALAVTTVDVPLDLGYVFSVEGKLPKALRGPLLFAPFKPQQSPMVDGHRPVRGQVLAGDKLLFYPYESMGTFLDLVNQAANDDECISIRITLYRVAKQSRLCESLISAAEHGKEVTVLMELRARFDEENNIEWAERLEDAGCTVLYGAEGFKVHSKICQITRRSGGEVVRITQLGTGNYNEKTAGLYSDYSLMTADPRIGEDANRFFRNMQIGNLQGEYRTLGVAPVGLKPFIMRGLNREIAKARAGERAYVFFKMNSLTDREVIDKISEASCAGVEVNMIIRGISCLLPGIPGKTENVHVRAIVGRMLEHARVYIFGEDHDTIYLSSADMMTRNTEHRVEIAYPLLDPIIRDQVQEDMRVQWADTVKARELTHDGAFERVSVPAGTAPMNAQEYFMRRALDEAAAKERALAERAHAQAHRPIPDGTDEETVRYAHPESDGHVVEEVPAHQAKPAPQMAPVAEEPTAPVGQTTSEPQVTTRQEVLGEQKPEVSSKAVSQVIVESKSEPSVEEVVATTIIEDERAEQDAMRDEKPSLELMVRQRGRASTAWALIKAGFRVLFGGRIS